MFNNGLLIQIAGISERTYLRYQKKLRNQGILQKKREFYFDEDEARKIAEAMGFKLKFEVYLTNVLKAK